MHAESQLGLRFNYLTPRALAKAVEGQPELRDRKPTISDQFEGQYKHALQEQSTSYADARATPQAVAGLGTKAKGIKLTALPGSKAESHGLSGAQVFWLQNGNLYQLLVISYPGEPTPTFEATVRLAKRAAGKPRP